jgi:hypothetical protein
MIVAGEARHGIRALLARNDVNAVAGEDVVESRATVGAPPGPYPWYVSLPGERCPKLLNQVRSA